MNLTLLPIAMNAMADPAIKAEPFNDANVTLLWRSSRAAEEEKLACLLEVGDQNSAEFDILVDGQMLVAEAATSCKPKAYCDQARQLPESKAKGRETGTEWIQAMGGNRAALLSCCSAGGAN